MHTPASLRLVTLVNGTRISFAVLSAELFRGSSSINVPGLELLGV